jgi:tetratricopeptide (TPR) repeat protein
MLDFAADEYKWCMHCGGNIRRSAQYCRYCHKNVHHHDPGLPTSPVVLRTIDEAAIWLPNFTELFTQLPVAFQTRVMLVDAETEGRIAEMGLPPMVDKDKRRNHSTVMGEVPRKSVVGLVQDCLLMLHGAGADMSAICSDLRLQLLEFTAEAIAKEFELRERETASGNHCRFCAECLMPGRNNCRFCVSDGSSPPEVENPSEQPVDRELLQAVLLWESASRLLNREEHIAEDVLARNGITKEKIQEQLVQEAEGSEYPVSNWVRKIISLRVPTTFPWIKLELEDLNGLARACLGAKLPQEAEIVVLHALSRADNSKELCLTRANLYETLSQVYAKLDKFDLAEQYKDKMVAERTTGLPDDLKEEAKKHEKEARAWVGPFNRFALEGPPEQQLKQLQAYMEHTQAFAQQMAAHMQKMLDGIVDMVNEAQMQMVPAFEARKLALEAEIAANALDIALAETKYEEALRILSDGWFDRIQYAGVACKLGDIKDKLMKHADAESLYKEAIEIGEELADEQPDMQYSSIGGACYKYAAFLLKHDRLEEAKQQVERSIENFDKHMQVGAKRADVPKEALSGTLYSVKGLYVEVLKELGEMEAAAKVAQECLALKDEAEKWKKQQGQRRRAVLEGLTPS